ncbi:MAG: hypothetical protein A3F47_00780 [Candidatus Staskawiczbacteria bacterium RIFCSPHIGHO2_12_FULL_38_11]|uniref:Uncharacterized protein n=1 Tax=Candidatus Staskawiczbacteria bacterium RIFCSPHIGHO2_12_FULL_38_11 TaxID=1802209 RepID=A0A1G2I6E5_9BACT|nr:MAG: hypothetical protein A3F47_00780 [Candidatus Staskawiczbacteria bacterium RIFCSPHIGHO2_12_FULL_38_11]
MAKKNKKITTVDELAVMINNGFQNTQDHFNKKFDALTGEMRNGFKKVNENFKEVNEKINNISKNIIDVVHKEEFDRLESRVTDVEEVAELASKKN